MKITRIAFVVNRGEKMDIFYDLLIDCKPENIIEKIGKKFEKLDNGTFILSKAVYFNEIKNKFNFPEHIEKIFEKIDKKEENGYIGIFINEDKIFNCKDIK